MKHLNRLLEDLADAWSGLWRRPLRSLLSSLGIGIGVTALVAMLSIGEGARKKALDKISSLGTNTLRVEQAAPAGRIDHDTLVNLSLGLTREDGREIAAWLGSRGTVGVYARRDNVLVTAGTRTTTATVLGVSPDWFSAEKIALTWGRPLSETDIEQQRSFSVIGSGVASALRATGHITLRVDNFPARILGVLAPRGRLLTEGTGLSSLDFDNLIIMPITTFPYTRILAGRRMLDGLVIALVDEQESEIIATAQQIRQILLLNHNAVEDFRIVVPLSLLNEARETQQLFSLVMGSIAGLSLLVGGIGVMNVMLANISEQTREIGLRMAVGATRARIISLYLWNSVLLTLTGGIWGLVGGVILAMVVQHYAGWEIAFSSFSLIIAPLSAVLTGVVFGLHPAMRAASLDPAIALRD